MLDPKKALILGANGQLGLELQKQYPEALAVDSDGLDITDLSALQSFDWTNITYILNAAAYTNVDGAESQEGRIASWKVNALAVGYLASIATLHDITLVHISSDYVFDGFQAEHTEDEPFSPLSVYGASKAAGDIAASTTAKYYVLRTSWVIGQGKNFVGTMRGLAEKGISPTVVADQIGRLTFTTELVRAIDHLLKNNLPYGTYNVSNAGEPASWADITREIFKQAGFNDLTVTDTTTKEYFAGKEGIAPRPLNSVLNLSKIETSGFLSTDWKKSLTDYLSNQ